MENGATETGLTPLSVPTLTLPPSEAALVGRLYSGAKVILEYGSGGSTLLAAAGPHDLIMTVESDEAWAANLRAVLARDFPDAPVVVHWEDIGPTKAWGRPQNGRAWRSFHRYPLAVWDAPWFRHPDLVLIDGRFRVACFMAVALRIKRPVTVLFDDYVPRPKYAWIERYFKPAEIVGRMARFEVTPLDLPRDALTELFARFNDPD